MSCESYGWGDDERVPIVDGRDLIYAGDDPELVRVSGFAWPCEEAPVHWVECLTQEEAVAAASHAREQLVMWIAGGGLHPVQVFYRWGIAALFLREEVPDEVVKLLMAMNAGGAGPVRMTRHVFEAIKPDEPWKRSMELVDMALHESALRGRYRKQADESSLAELLEWISGELLDIPCGVSEEAFVDDVREVARGSMRLICRWLMGSGSGALQILQRTYALIFYRYKSIGQGMTGHDLAALVRQCRATFCEETSRWFEEPGELLLGYRPKSSSGQKSPDCSDVYRDNAQLHCPRRQMDGTAGLDAEDRAAALNQEVAARKSAEARAAQIVDDWETATAWLSFIGDERDRRERFGELTPSQRECIRILREREEREG